MVAVKRLFDPEGRLNPGVMVDAAPLRDHLRDPALAPAAQLQTHFEFSDGMRGAADRCMRIGACRKTGSGVMCPSYMATREEEHSTRGRANALVKALSEPDPQGALGDGRLHEILDLCLECKACKSECPLSVDMATLKAEFLSHYHELHGTPIRSRLFGSIRTLNRIGAFTAPFSNAPARIGPARALLERTFGIARRRPLPRFERETLIRWQARRDPPTAPAPRGEVVLLADSFTAYTEPAIGRAAVELLEAAGHRMTLESAGCCGRAAISKGLLAKAQRQAAQLAGRLGPPALRGVPIAGVEPSCLLTLTEEHVALLGGGEGRDGRDGGGAKGGGGDERERRRAIAAQATLVEDLLVAALDDGAFEFAVDSPLAGRRVLLHGHCHQKALHGTTATRALLERIPGVEVSELDAGCCGMAGSFGFEAEHYELSLQIGEQRLFPALRADAGAVVAATGVSCRQQIAHGTDRVALHPIVLARSALPV